MGVGVARIEMVHRRPFHFAPEVPLERRHQAPHVDGEVELRTVFRRDNKPKLVFLAGTRLLEDARAYRPSRVVERALRAVLFDPIAFDVAHVQGGGLGGGRSHAQQMGLDDYAARAGLKRVNARRAAPGRSTDARQDRVAERARSVRRPARAACTHPRPKNREFVVARDFCHRISVVLSAGSVGEGTIVDFSSPQMDCRIHNLDTNRHTLFILPSVFTPGL